MKNFLFLFCIFFMQVARSQPKTEPFDSAKHKNQTGASTESQPSLKKLIVIDGQIWGYAKSYNQLDSLMAPRITADIRYLNPAEADKKYTLRNSAGAIEIRRTGNTYGNAGKDKENILDDQEPSFPGGPTAWRRFLERNVNAMAPSDSGAPAGFYQAAVKFKVNKDGKLSDFQAISSVGYGTETELIRVLKKGPDWIPGTQNGTPVISYHLQKLSFVVESDMVSFDFKGRNPYELISNQPQTIGISLYEKSGDELEVTLSKGKVRKKENNEYELLVEEKGTVILTVRNKKKNTEAGKASFTVK